MPPRRVGEELLACWRRKEFCLKSERALARAAQMVGTSSCRQKGWRFDSRSGHMLRLWVCPQLGRTQVGKWSLSLSLSFSFSLPHIPSLGEDEKKVSEKEFSKMIKKSILGWLSGLNDGLWTKGLLVWFPVREYAWVAGQVPDRGHRRGNHTLIFLSVCFSLPSPLSKNK